MNDPWALEKWETKLKMKKETQSIRESGGREEDEAMAPELEAELEI